MSRGGRDDDNVIPMDPKRRKAKGARRGGLNELAKDIDKQEDYAKVRAAVVEEMNERHSIVTYGNETSIMVEGPSTLHPGSVDFRFLSDRSMKLLFQNQMVTVGYSDRTGDPIMQSKYAIWAAHPDRRQYDRMILDPSLPPGGDDETRTFNRWRGWPWIDALAEAQKRKPDPSKWKLLRAYLREVICCGQEDRYQWLLAWLRRLLVKPEQGSGILLALIGDEGTGKGFFFTEVIGRMYDPHHFSVMANPSQVVRNFNAHTRDALFLYCDEAFFHGNKSAGNILYDMITGKILLVEPKGRDVEVEWNRRNYGAGSNDDVALYAKIGARRFTVFRIDNSKAEDRAYFEKLVAEMEAGGHVEFVRFLLENEFAADPTHAFLTEELLEQKLGNFDSIERFVYDRLDTQYLPDINSSGYVPWTNATSVTVSSSRLLDAYKSTDYVERAHVNELRNAASTLVKRLRRLIPSIREHRPKSLVKGGPRPRHYVFPPLDVARREFIRSVKQDPWSEEK